MTQDARSHTDADAAANLAAHREFERRLDDLEDESARLVAAVAAQARKAPGLATLAVRAKRRLVPDGSTVDQIYGYAKATAVMGLRRVLRGPASAEDLSTDRVGEDLPAEHGSGLLAEGAGGPLFSVIMAVYNAQRSNPDYLRLALDSVAAQTYEGFELLVVDDGSDDDTLAVVESWLQQHPGLAATVLRKTNGGQSSARNLAAAHARGEWLTFLDQDDLWVPHRLDAVIPLLSPDVDLVYTDANTIDAKGNLEYPRIHLTLKAGGEHPKTKLDDALYRDVYVMPGVTTIRRRLYQAMGGFDEELSGYEDDDLFVRTLARAARVVYYPRPTLQWRMYDHNYSRSGRMVSSRIKYWRKLMANFTDGGRDKRRARLITLRFMQEFLSQSILLRDDDATLAAQNFEAARELVPHLGAVDRCAFAATRWAWTGTDRAAHLGRWWFVNGLGGRS